MNTKSVVILHRSMQRFLPIPRHQSSSLLLFSSSIIIPTSKKSVSVRVVFYHHCRRNMSSSSSKSSSSIMPPPPPASSSSLTSATTNNTNQYVSDMFNLYGKTCIVTGGGTGIGAALAEGLAKAGCTVIITGRRQSVLDNTAQYINNQLVESSSLSNNNNNNNNNSSSTTTQPQQQQQQQSSSPRRVFGISCDITDYNSIPQLIEQTTDIANGIGPTILINNAGINVRQPVDQVTVEDFETSFHLMLIAPFVLARAMVPIMQQENYGRIISIASLQSYQAFPNSIPYAIAKSGILGYTRSLAEVYSPTYGYNGITVNAIAPGYVKTALTEKVFADVVRAQQLADRTIVGRNSVPQDLIGTCLFLCSPTASSYITGQTIPVDGGFTALGLR